MKILMCLILSLIIAGCGGALLPSRVHTVDDGTYMLDMVKNEQERFHFQVCRETKRKGGVPELEATLRGNAEAHCFNPFYGEGGEYAYFSSVPAAGHLQGKGVAMKVMRYVTKTGLVVTFSAFALILIPKAAKLVLATLFSTKKNSDIVAKTSAISQGMLAKAEGKPMTKKQLQDQRDRFKLFESRPMRFLVSLFVIDGVFEGWRLAYDGYNSLDGKLEEAEWGEKELNLVKAYPYLALLQTHKVTDLKKILQALQVHLHLVFSDEYLNEFEPSPS